VGATGGSAHGGASPPVNSAGSGCPPGPKARDSRVDVSGTTRVPLTRRLLPLRLLSFPFLASGSVQSSPVLSTSHTLSPRESPPSSRSPLPVMALTITFHGSIQAPPRVSPPLLPSCFSPLPSPSFPFLASSSLRFSPLRSPLPRPRDFFIPPTRVYLRSFSLALPFLASSFSDLVAAPPSRPQTLRLYPRSPFESRFHRPGFGARLLWPASHAEAPSHHSPGAAKSTGR